MYVYWTLKRVPELSALGFWERGRAWRTAVWASRFYLDRRYWASVVVLVAGICVGSVAGVFVGSLIFGSTILGIFLAVPVVMLAALWHAQVLTEVVRPHIREGKRAP